MKKSKFFVLFLSLAFSSLNLSAIKKAIPRLAFKSFLDLLDDNKSKPLRNLKGIYESKEYKKQIKDKYQTGDLSLDGCCFEPFDEDKTNYLIGTQSNFTSQIGILLGRIEPDWQNGRNGLMFFNILYKFFDFCGNKDQLLFLNILQHPEIDFMVTLSDEERDWFEGFIKSEFKKKLSDSKNSLNILPYIIMDKSVGYTILAIIALGLAKGTHYIYKLIQNKKLIEKIKGNQISLSTLENAKINELQAAISETSDSQVKSQLSRQILELINKDKALYKKFQFLVQS